MSIQTEIDRIASAKAAIKTAIESKGVTVPDATPLDGMTALIESIQVGGSDYIVEAHIVTFAEEIVCAAGASVELCDTAIQTPLCIGMVTYEDFAKKNAYVPILSFGTSFELTKATPTSGYALATTDSSYTSTSKGYVKLYSNMAGSYNYEYDNGLFVKDGKLRWSNEDGMGYSRNTSAKFLSGARYIFFILGVRA